MRKFDITYYFGPDAKHIITEDCVSDIARCGFTLTQLCCDTETNKKALTVMRKYGLCADVGDSRISALFRDKDFSNVDAVVKSVVNDYADFDNIEGWDITDEPSTEDFPILGAIVSAFRRYSPDKETYINLFPNYASDKQLKDADYTSHLEHFVKEVNPHFISYDHYHFLGRPKVSEKYDNISERERLIRIAANKTENRAGFFENAEEIRRVGLENNLEQMLIVLLVEHGPYRNLSFEELLWEVNMCLVYGFKRISYFTYWLPEGDDDHWHYENSICDTDGNKLQHYYDVQKINKTIMPVGEHLFNTKSKEVFHIGESEKGTRSFSQFGKINKIDGNNAVIGFFEDGSVYLVNRDYINENSLTVYADSEMSVFDGEGFKFVGKEFTFNLSAGEAVLIKFN